MLPPVKPVLDSSTHGYTQAPNPHWPISLPVRLPDAVVLFLVLASPPSVVGILQLDWVRLTTLSCWQSVILLREIMRLLNEYSVQIGSVMDYGYELWGFGQRKGWTYMYIWMISYNISISSQCYFEYIPSTNRIIVKPHPHVQYSRLMQLYHRNVMQLLKRFASP